MIWIGAAALLLLAIVLLWHGTVYLAWALPSAAALGYWAATGAPPRPLFLALAGGWALTALVFGLRPLRRALISGPAMRLMGRAMPRMSRTERTALEAGSVWWDGELFTGAPRWDRLLDFRIKPLSERERAFLDGPVEELCRMVDEWSVEKARDLPPAAWEHLKRHGFFGMIIPEEYGGLGFSAQANSAVVVKLASRSVTAAVTVMVPNSLGPAELILHYGTDEQKKRLLPRLARGEEIPCFALTEPEAGSDAASIRSTGVVCRGTFDGREVVGMRLTWDKRYTTLAPVATILGLAIRLTDPEGLLGPDKEPGITVALIPTSVPGVEVGRRHDPMGLAFLNGPTQGTDVFVPVDFIVGGPAMAGQGWRMLMECLAAGRSISLPALAAASAQMSARLAGAYATIRRQFDSPLGRFEGIEEPLARIAGLAYAMDAARRLTAGAVDTGEKPAVLSAIVKAYLTESMRRVINDAMDVLGGAGVSRGPRNPLAHAYQAVPVGITVEGANILARTLIIFGQGALRGHPHVLEELRAVEARDASRFDRAFFGHLAGTVRHAVRSFLGGWFEPRLAERPEALRRRLTRASAAFALAADVALATLGGTLKRREKLSGRLADALAWMYLGSAILKRFHDEGRPEADRPFAAWAGQLASWEIQQALAGLIDNLPNRAAALALRLLVFPRGARVRPPSDRAGHAAAQALLEGRESWRRLTRDIHVPAPEDPGLGRLEAALATVMRAGEAETKIRDAVRRGAIERSPGETLADRAQAAGIITPDDRARLREAEEARRRAVAVDAFDPSAGGWIPR